MSPAETLRVALGGIATNRLRSGLTILGMTIGVASVIVLVAVGNGSERQVQAGIQALGSNVLLVQAAGARGGPGDPRVVRAADADALWPLLAPRLAPDAVILLKASRGVRLERLVPHLEAWAGAPGAAS